METLFKVHCMETIRSTLHKLKTLVKVCDFCMLITLVQIYKYEESIKSKCSPFDFKVRSYLYHFTT